MRILDPPDPSVQKPNSTAKNTHNWLVARYCASSAFPGCAILGLLLNLEAVHDRRKVAQDLIGFLVELQLRSNQISQVTEGLGGVEDL